MEAEKTSEPAEVRFKDLRSGSPPVHIVARVLTASRRQITRRSDGGRRWILSGLLTDGTATVRFTWWDPPPDDLGRGTVLRASNAQVRDFRGSPELSFGWQTRVAPANDEELPEALGDMVLRKVAELAPRDEGFRLEVRVVDVQSRTVSVREERRLVHSGSFADESGRIRFTAWVDFRLTAGEAYRISGGYVRAFRGRSELVLDDRTEVERLPEHHLPELPRLASPVSETVGGVQRRGGAEDVLVEGLVLGLVSPSGVVYRCPNCQRLVQRGICRVHGPVEGEADLRARVVVDDGTGVVTANLGRAPTEQLTGRTLSTYLDRLRAQPDPGALEQEIWERLFGRRIRVRGSAQVDEFGVSMFATEAMTLEPDPARSITELEQRLEGSQA